MAENTNVMVVNSNAKLPLVIEENSLFAYFEKIKKFPVLTESEEHGLITDFKQNGNLAADLPPLRSAAGGYRFRSQYRSDAGCEKVWLG